MRYDRLGFPIPAEFEPPADQADREGGGRPARPQPAKRKTARPGKRLFLGLIAGLVIVPLVVGPALLPVLREGVIEWSLQRAIAHEGRGNVRWAANDIGRAIDWLGDPRQDPSRKSRLLCWRAMLRIEDAAPDLGLADADQAAVTDPMAVQPQRVRALALCVLGDFEQALQAAQMSVGLAGDGDPDALNHRAYIRALAGRDLEAALDDINRALTGSGEGSAEYLDTRGYLLHLLGRQQEALDDLNIAVTTAQEDRRRLLLLAGHVHEEEFAYRLRTTDHSLAVMLQHRGLACEALGLEAQARQDFAIARNKGFDPSRGVW